MGRLTRGSGGKGGREWAGHFNVCAEKIESFKRTNLTIVARRHPFIYHLPGIVFYLFDIYMWYVTQYLDAVKNVLKLYDLLLYMARKIDLQPLNSCHYFLTSGML